MALKMLRGMALGTSNSAFYSIMADVSNKEQLALCFWWVDDEFEICEDFFSLYLVPNTYFCSCHQTLS